MGPKVEFSKRDTIAGDLIRISKIKDYKLKNGDQTGSLMSPNLGAILCLTKPSAVTVSSTPLPLNFVA